MNLFQDPLPNFGSQWYFSCHLEFPYTSTKVLYISVLFIMTGFLVVVRVKFVAVPRESQWQWIYLCMRKERLHKISLRTRESLRGILSLSPLSQPPDALRRMDQTDGRQRRIRKRSVIAQRNPLYFQFSWQPRRVCTRWVSPHQVSAGVHEAVSKLWGESARKRGAAAWFASDAHEVE